MPDDVLVSEIARIPGVVGVDVEYTPRTPTHEAWYTGTVRVDEDADAACVLDRAFALLWQGRSAILLVDVEQAGTSSSSEDLLGFPGQPFIPEVYERYGERTGSREFVEPADPPACRGG